ncbi:MAG: hypothetical protein Q7S55_00530 [Nanoarchaeota archaeon]|nr:hypothetical protein [Nanoarchaeota archaeon]
MSSLSCPKCKSWETVKRGIRYTKSEPKQLYRCNACSSTFVNPDGFERMRHKPGVILSAVLGDAERLSLFRTQKYLQQKHEISVTRKTINRWKKKYKHFLKKVN